MYYLITREYIGDYNEELLNYDHTAVRDKPVFGDDKSFVIANVRVTDNGSYDNMEDAIKAIANLKGYNEHRNCTIPKLHGENEVYVAKPGRYPTMTRAEMKSICQEDEIVDAIHGDMDNDELETFANRWEEYIANETGACFGRNRYMFIEFIRGVRDEFKEDPSRTEYNKSR